MSDHPLQRVIDALNAERYGPSLWWETPKHNAADDDAAQERTAVLDLAHDADEDELDEGVESA
jgi:hypothetical protein